MVFYLKNDIINLLVKEGASVMEERDWVILTTLYENKNITKTARDLYISQPALTNRLQHIEDEFNVKVVNRGSRGVTFTTEGECLVSYANEMLLSLTKLKEDINNLEKSVKGTLRIAASRFIGKYKLPRMLNQFKELYPEVDFYITSCLSSTALDLLYNRDVHVSFTRGEHNWPGCRNLLFEENLCIVSKNRIEFDNLPSLPRVLFQLDGTTKTILNNWWMDNFSSPPQIVAEVDSLDTCKEMVLCGLGYAIVPSNIVASHKDLYCIDIKDKSGNVITRNNWIFYHEESLKLNIVKAFVDFAKDYDYISI